MQYLILLVAAFFNATSCFISYKKELHSFWWYVPLGILVGSVCNYLWFSGTKIVSEQKEIYAFSMMYDFTLVLVYYFLPILIFGIKFNKIGLIGISMMFIGIMLIKFSSAQINGQ